MNFLSSAPKGASRTVNFRSWIRDATCITAPILTSTYRFVGAPMRLECSRLLLFSHRKAIDVTSRIAHLTTADCPRINVCASLIHNISHDDGSASRRVNSPKRSVVERGRSPSSGLADARDKHPAVPSRDMRARQVITSTKKNKNAAQKAEVGIQIRHEAAKRRASR